MAARITIAMVLGAVAVALAVLADRRTKARNRVTAPVATSHVAPVQLLRADFVRPDAEWLVVTFSSAACGGCAAMVKKVAVLESDEVATCEVEFTEQRDIHERYAVDAVPLVLVADRGGVVRRHFFGSTSATDLWAALAELRGTELPQH